MIHFAQVGRHARRHPQLPLTARSNAESTDPMVIPGLIGALGTGNMVILGLSRFGDRAAKPLIEVLEDVAQEPSPRSSAAKALAAMLEAEGSGKATEATRSEIARAARAIFRRPEPFIVVVNVLELVVQLGVPDLVKVAERIADNPDLALVSDADAMDRKNLQRRTKLALTRRASLPQ